MFAFVAMSGPNPRILGLARERRLGSCWSSAVSLSSPTASVSSHCDNALSIALVGDRNGLSSGVSS